MSGWLLIVTLLVLGGVLATLGDRLGTKVGKARLSLFRLRPRNTAVLITALTGSLISALSLGLMLLVSQQLRVGLFELDQIQARLAGSRNDLERSRADLERSRGELRRSEEERKRAERGRRDAVLGRQRAVASQRNARRQLADAEQRAQRLRADLQPLQNQRQRLEAERRRLSRDVKARDADIRRTTAELASVQQRIAAGEGELRALEANLIALRRGDVVIASGQRLAMAKVTLQRRDQARPVIDTLLQQANRAAFERVLPGKPVDHQILMIPRSDISRLEDLMGRPGTWVVSILAATNVLRGETRVLALPDLRPNQRVGAAGEVLARATIEAEVRSPQEVAERLNLLLAASYARAQRQGTLAEGLEFDLGRFNALGQALSQRPAGQVAVVEAVLRQDAETPDPLRVELRWQPKP
ncbi:MAG: DUF3084 domain-containing protein [Cyanobacteriota bacterium]|nr:DUF3084 domain-containing protein [Cyanobacteriota bacterium]